MDHRAVRDEGFFSRRCPVSTQHANFIINTGRATAADVLELIHIIRKKVHEKTSIWLECEVRYIGPHGDIAPAHLHSEVAEIN